MIRRLGKVLTVVSLGLACDTYESASGLTNAIVAIVLLRDNHRCEELATNVVGT
ncbi:hypothetical protein [Schlesneria paludicola]|uniref:hypothetical protein n=1 Tax=Schlesneria paludicola TaxID=360056 RepID=UPI0002D5AB9B|nr:hypothetical protein [Schlesneria paludicola]